MWKLLIGVLASWIALGVQTAFAYDCEAILRRPDGQALTLYFGAKPGTEEELQALCLKRLPVVKEFKFREKGEKSLGDVSDERARSAVRDLSGQPLIVLDIESWKTSGSESVVSESVRKLKRVLSLAKQELPGTSVGFYSMVPLRDYYRALTQPDGSEFKRWQSENDRLRALSDAVDALFPSVYTFKREAPEDWGRYALANVAEARRLAPTKPILPFIWPRYHGSSENVGKQPIEPEFLAAQFHILLQSPETSGFVIWLHSKDGWDENANWHVALRAFLDERSR
jgi:hypothetical protein